jgi:hypothetical protein
MKESKSAASEVKSPMKQSDPVKGDKSFTNKVSGSNSSKKNSGQAGKFKRLHKELLFINRTNEESFNIQNSLKGNVEIKSNIPDTNKVDCMVLSSRVILFELSIYTEKSSKEELNNLLAFLDVVYIDTGEKVKCLSKKNQGKHILSKHKTARFDLISSEGELEHWKAQFEVKFRETSRDHMDTTAKNRKFCFRFSLFRFITSFGLCYVSDSRSFRVIERERRSLPASQQVKEKALKQQNKTKSSKVVMDNLLKKSNQSKNDPNYPPLHRSSFQFVKNKLHWIFCLYNALPRK